jgi:ATP-binding cassette, subfamily C, bacterial
MIGALVAIGLYVALEFYGMHLSAVMVLTLLVARVLLQSTKLQQRYQDMMVCESAYWSLQSSIDGAHQEAEPVMGERRVELREAIHLENIWFAYRDDWVLRGLSLDMPAGSLTALTGASGGGKTTIIDLTTGLLRPQRGEVFIDRVPLAEVDLHHWRRSIGYVPQDTFLLHDTMSAQRHPGRPRAGRSGGGGTPCARRMCGTTSKRSRRVCIPLSVNAAAVSPAGSGSASPSPGPWRTGPGC